MERARWEKGTPFGIENKVEHPTPYEETSEEESKGQIPVHPGAIYIEAATPAMRTPNIST